MYEVFDNFLATDTWHVRHPNDEHNFYLPLDKFVWSDDFNPDQMAAYMGTSCNIPSNYIDSVFAQSIDRLRENA
jgi:hypothetical protein